jgi:predicted PhzF superfamily epimerase YddE/YHI9
MQKIAAEINFAESTFVTVLDKYGNGNDLRILIPDKKCSLWTSHNWDIVC